MSRFLPALLTGFYLLASSAAMAGPQETLIAWQYVQDPDSGATFEEISDFLEQHPIYWPDEKRIRIRAERTMRAAGLSDNDVIAWFAASPPISGIGKWSYAEALTRQNLHNDEAAKLIREAWRDADLTEDEENTFLVEFGSRLDEKDHIARIDRLLWEGKTTPAKRMWPKLPVARQLLYQARAALMHDDKAAPTLVSHIGGALANDPGLLYERMRYRARKDDDNGVREILLAVPKNVPYPERWWKIREGEIRRSIDEGNYKMASRLLENHGQSEGASYADALWLDGWLNLEFLNNPKEAYATFIQMHEAVRTPVSKARAAYWTGRAAKKNGDKSSAREWFTTATKHSTTFYGQLAQSELSINMPLHLPDQPSFAGFTSDPILGDGIEEAIRICIKNDDRKLATRLINHVIDKAESEHSMLAVAGLGHELSVPNISVKAAKKAQQKGVVLKDVGYPRPETEQDFPIERALTLAIIRQESEFDPEAESPAGALGMMQLLPGTAKETARKISLPYEGSQLTSPNYNMRLGSNYLARMINAYDGSYVMAIAAYNAGPGNVRKWIQQFGTPGTNAYDAINWIEKIPFYETRNYVQRVLENLQVYRALEGKDTLMIQDDLVR